MTLDALFALSSGLAALGWLLLCMRPLAPRAIDGAAGLALPLTLSLLYTGLILAHWTSATGGFGSLAEVMELFTQQPVALAGWTHYLAFDLFVGAVSLRLATEQGVAHWLMLPVLALTFLFGPIGLVATAILVGTARATARATPAN